MNRRKTRHYDVYELIAKNIKYYRKERNMTQAELAEKTEYSHEFIRRIESPKGAKTFSVDTIWKISLAVNINPGKLFDIDMEELVNQSKK